MEQYNFIGEGDVPKHVIQTDLVLKVTEVLEAKGLTQSSSLDMH